MFVTVQRSDGNTAVVGIQSDELLPDIFDFVVLTKKFDVFADG